MWVRHRRSSSCVFQNSPGRKKRAHLLRPHSRRGSPWWPGAPRGWGSGLSRALIHATCSHVLHLFQTAPHPHLRGLAPDPQALSLTLLSLLSPAHPSACLLLSYPSGISSDSTSSRKPSWTAPPHYISELSPSPRLRLMAYRPHSLLAKEATALGSLVLVASLGPSPVPGVQGVTGDMTAVTSPSPLLSSPNPEVSGCSVGCGPGV